MMSTCRHSHVVEPVKRKKDGFIRTRGNGRKCSLPENSSPVTVGAKGPKSQYQKREILPNQNKEKRATVAGEVNSEAFKVRSAYSAKNSKSLKDKACKTPFVYSSNAAATVSAKLMKKPTKVINHVSYHSNPTLVSDSAIIDDNVEYNLLGSEISDQELQDLNLLPHGLQPHKSTITPLSTPEKSERHISGGFYGFDGSRFSPIEEASLILHTPISDAYSIDSCSIPSVASDFESNFLSSEQDFSTPASTPQKFERVNAIGFESFDGSKFSPIEEASLLLNSPNEDMFISPVSSTKGTSKRLSSRGLHKFDGSSFSPIEKSFPVFNSPIKDPFMSPVISEYTPKKMLHMSDWNACPTLQLQSSPTQCFDPWYEKTKSVHGASNGKCSWEGIISSESSKAYRMRSSCSKSTISKKKQQHTNGIGEVEWFSNPIFLNDSGVGDEAERDLLSYGTSEEELLSLNLLPAGLSPKEEIITSTYTLDTPKTVGCGGILNFDGSSFSPMEESFLILNRPIANKYACNTYKGKQASEVIELRGKVDLCSSLEAELEHEKPQSKKLDRILKIQTELLQVKAQIKELGWLLESSLGRADMLL